MNELRNDSVWPAISVITKIDCAIGGREKHNKYYNMQRKYATKQIGDSTENVNAIYAIIKQIINQIHNVGVMK